MTAELVDKARAAGVARVKAAALAIAHSSPKLADLSQGDLEKLARVVIAGELRDNLKKAADLERVDYAAERDHFLDISKSPRTRNLYDRGLTRLEEWCVSRNISALELTPATADDWIKDQGGRASASVRLDASAASAFWTWLERRYTWLRNPFRGSRARPVKKPVRKLEVPTAEEVAAIIAAADGQLRGAVYVMGYLGLRVGGLPGFSIRGNRWTTVSKGKEISGPTPETAADFAEVRAELVRLGLPLRGPFADSSTTQITDRFKRLVKKMMNRGQLETAYSVHDLRHAYAVRLYGATHDVYAVKRGLVHSDFRATEQYLRSLDLDV